MSNSVTWTGSALATFEAEWDADNDAEFDDDEFDSGVFVDDELLTID